MIKRQIKVNKDNVIEDAKFKTFGCGSTIACSSFASEKIIGMKIEDAQKITNFMLSNELNLPPLSYTEVCWQNKLLSGSARFDFKVFWNEAGAARFKIM